MKNQQRKWNSLFLLISTSWLLISCDSNEICFDLKKQIVCSKDNAKLSKLLIDEENGDLIWITKKDGKMVDEYFSFEKLDTLNYLYEKSGYISKKIDYFYLKPNTTYEVENKSDGDASGGKLTIKTNSNCKVFYSSDICD
jgi:hypothetical protein